MASLSSSVLPGFIVTMLSCVWLHLADSSRTTMDCSPQVDLPCTVYTYNDELHGYEISMQGIKGVAKGIRKCFVIDTRNTHAGANTEVIYNFTISPVLTNSEYHFRILPLPNMSNKGSANTAIVETRSDSVQTSASDWTTKVNCEVRHVHKLTKVYVEYDLPPAIFKFPGVTVELVLDDAIISKQLSKKPFNLFETMKHGNYQVWVTPDDPFIYSPRACLCRNSDDVCAGSCMTSFGFCEVIPVSESGGMETIESQSIMSRPLTICLTIAAVGVCVTVTLVVFGYRHCKRRKDRNNKEITFSNNNAGHKCTFVQPDITEETGANSSFPPVSLKHTNLISKPNYSHMSDRSDQYLHASLINDSLSNHACPELISLGGQSV